MKHKDNIWKIHEHDTLLENQVDEHLTEEERKAAWEEFENEKKGIINMTNTSNLNMNLMMNQINPEVIRVRILEKNVFFSSFTEHTVYIFDVQITSLIWIQIHTKGLMARIFIE